MWDSSTYLGALTPKFYVALTGTSSLISGLILIFEWWYFRKYGTSFIEQMSLMQLSPWLGGPAILSCDAASGPATGCGGAAPECKVWRNPMALLRGAEYARLWSAARRAPLTYYDMNLSAQEHQAWFGAGDGETGNEGDADGESPDEATEAAEAHMARAWRARSSAVRVAAARAALAERADCVAALLLLAEEDAPTVQEAERVLRRAWRAGEAAYRARGAGSGPRARRCAALLAHVKRRVAMCARRLGKLRDATRMFRELARDAPPALASLATHENLIEVLLEQRAYADVQGVVVRYEECSASRSATTVYTSALLRARAAAAAAPPARASAELAALEAMRRAIEFNPHVPQYLLELRALTLPPEHVVRRGDSEALAYAFWHLRHWQHVDGALRLLALAAQAAERSGKTRAGWSHGAGGGGGGASGRGERCTSCGACGDLELLGARGWAWGWSVGRTWVRKHAMLLCACLLAATAALLHPAAVTLRRALTGF